MSYVSKNDKPEKQWYVMIPVDLIVSLTFILRFVSKFALNLWMRVLRSCPFSLISSSSLFQHFFPSLKFYSSMESFETCAYIHHDLPTLFLTQIKDSHWTSSILKLYLGYWLLPKMHDLFWVSYHQSTVGMFSSFNWSFLLAESRHFPSNWSVGVLCGHCIVSCTLIGLAYPVSFFYFSFFSNDPILQLFVIFELKIDPEIQLSF